MKPVSWDGHNINDLSKYSTVIRLPAAGLEHVGAVLAKRSGQWPVVAALDRPGRYIILDITIESGGSKSELAGWFDPEDETARQLIVESVDGSNDRYWMGVCEHLLDDSPGATHFEALIRIHGDIRLREVTPTTDTVALTATGQTKNLTNNGADLAFMNLKVKPTSANATGFTKKRQILIHWRATSAYSKYPVDLTNDAFDTAAEIAGGDMQADGDDLRVYLNGNEIDRWLDGINTTTTKVWCNLDMQPDIAWILKTAIASSGSINFIDVTEMSRGLFSNLPPSGVVVIDSEAFSYTSKKNQTLKLEGITRAVKGTSMAAHSAGNEVWWMQHDLVIYYKDSTLSAPTVDDNYKPAFNLATSTNTSWDYDEFGEDDGLRTGAWQFVNSSNSSQKYTANQNTDADPWSEMGIANNILGTGLSYARWEIGNPCGITNANFANGEKRSQTNLAAWYASIQSRNSGGAFTLEDTIAAPSVTGAWEAWSDNEALTANAIAVILQLQRAKGVPNNEDQMLEVADVTLTLLSTKTPVSTIGAEQSNYSLVMRITNNITGEAIDLAFGMELTQQLEIDTDARTVTYLKDSTNQFQALTLVGGPRKDWLKLVPGVNVIQFDETGLVAVTVDFEWEERHYN